MLVSFVLLVLGAGLSLLGAAAMRRSTKLAAGIAIPLLGLVLFKLALSRIPAAEPRLFSWDAYPFLEPWWALAPVAFLFGAGFYAARGSVWKRDLLLVLIGLLALRTGLVAWESRGDHARLRGTVDESGVCRQTSEYSCAAAASAALLQRYGVAATEREMALLCVTRPGIGGTSESGVLRGLRRKLPGRRIRISAPDFERLPVPTLVSLRLSLLLSHAVIVERVTSDTVFLMDPEAGRRPLSRAEFERRWTGSAIHVE